MHAINFLDARLPQPFWDRVSPCPMTGCWLWIGASQSTGYGCSYFQKKAVKAHRHSYSVLVGDIPPGLHIDHLCRVTCCVNPAHLEAVTPRVNQLRGTGFSAQNAQKTECKRGHEFNAANAMLRTHNGFSGPIEQRECRECKRERARAKLTVRGAEALEIVSELQPERWEDVWSLYRQKSGRLLRRGSELMAAALVRQGFVTQGDRLQVTERGREALRLRMEVA